MTGGAGGIGGKVVQLFAERNIKVVVLDVIPMTFEARKSVSYLMNVSTCTEAMAGLRHTGIPIAP